VSLSNPIITIITPVYNGEEYIEETILSVFSAAMEIGFEYIVVNDGSTDGTLNILNKYQDKIRIIDKSNSGESDSVNIAMRESRADLLLVVSADDPLLTKRIFQESFEDFTKDPNLVAIYPDWNMIGPKGEHIKVINVPDYSDALLVGRCITLPGPGVIFRKSAALQIGGRRKKWEFVSDHDFWLRLSRIGELRHRPEVLAQWRYHPGSTSISKRNSKMASERIAVVEEFLAEYKIDSKISRMALGNAYFMAARLVFFCPAIPGKKYLIKAFQKRQGWVEEAPIHIILYILFTPISSFLYKLFSRFFPIKKTLK
jgi:glycosyltransferase involved in cell wall biosynthesis